MIFCLPFPSPSIDRAADSHLSEVIYQLGVERAFTVAVQSFVATDELVAEAQPQHEALFLQPKDGTERLEKRTPSTAANLSMQMIINKKVLMIQTKIVEASTEVYKFNQCGWKVAIMFITDV